MTGADDRTAAAFADSWNRVGAGSVYSHEQFIEWFAPLKPADLEGKSVLELGFGNGSLLFHVAQCGPARLAGVELGDTIETARQNVTPVATVPLELHRGDLTVMELGKFDVVYCIGVLHHLADPEAGFKAVLQHVRPGGSFHCWVYAFEGNALIRTIVEPIRRVASHLPWWVTKYGLALPLVTPYFVYAKLLRRATARSDRARLIAAHLPLHDYTQWIARNRFRFFRHVAFDQLVTPRTAYLRRRTVEQWLGDPRVEPASAYIRFRNGNSWTFGGRTRADG